EKCDCWLASACKQSRREGPFSRSPRHGDSSFQPGKGLVESLAGENSGTFSAAQHRHAEGPHTKPGRTACHRAYKRGNKAAGETYVAAEFVWSATYFSALGPHCAVHESAFDRSCRKRILAGVGQQH